MRKIIQDIILSERCSLNVALIVYRDHPPQEHTFAIQVNDFTDGEGIAKTNVTASVPRSGLTFKFYCEISARIIFRRRSSRSNGTRITCSCS